MRCCMPTGGWHDAWPGNRGIKVDGTGFEAGTVWLVGAGPGDPGLLTLHAAHALAEADIVLHDALVSPDILALAPRARLEPVGKRAGGERTPQLRINERLIRLAREGHRVVRLKGGDPLVFGRGSGGGAGTGRGRRAVPHRPRRQRRYRRHGLPPAFRPPIAAWHTASPSSTGHDAAGELPADLDWDALARGADVLVLYMALRQIGAIAAHLRAAGRDRRGAGRLHHRGDHPAPTRRRHDARAGGGRLRRNSRQCADTDRDGSGRRSAAADRRMAGRCADVLRTRGAPRDRLRRKHAKPADAARDRALPGRSDQRAEQHHVGDQRGAADLAERLSRRLPGGDRAAAGGCRAARAPRAAHDPVRHRIRQRRGAGRCRPQGGRQAGLCRAGARHGGCHARPGGRRAEPAGDRQHLGRGRSAATRGRLPCRH